MRSDAGELKVNVERALGEAGALHASGAGGPQVAARLAAFFDELLGSLVDRALTTLGRPRDGLALVALGGYGRAQLAPYSDLDLMILHTGWPSDEIEEVNRRVLYPLWDAGLDLGNRVRSLRDASRVPDRIDEATALLDARLVAGDGALFAAFVAAQEAAVRRAGARMLRGIREENARRHASAGHAGHLLEPDIRDSAGGLRDVHGLGWAGDLLRHGAGRDELRTRGILSEVDSLLIDQAAGFLLHLRIQMHVSAARRQDKLLLADQDTVAEALGYRSTDAEAPGDALMREVYRHARTVDAIASSVWEQLAHPRRRRIRRAPVRSLGDGCVERDGRIEVVAAQSPDQDAAGWLRVFLKSARAGVPVGRSTLNHLHAICAASKCAVWSAAAREAFVELLWMGARASRALEAMDGTGFLSLLLPEWAPLRCRPQRNLYHRYTVDVHSFAAVDELVASRSIDEPDVADAWSRAGTADALVLGTLLHDVGKGRGGDHVVIGEALAGEALARLGFNARVVDDVRFLVREHLALAEIATRRDLNDERTAAEAASRAGSVDRLAMLFLLTRADAIATGPEAWSGFRASLIRELYAKTLHLMEGREGPTAGPARERSRGAIVERLASHGISADEAVRMIAAMPPSWLGAFDAAAAADQLAMMRRPPAAGDVRLRADRSSDADVVSIVAADRPGLFATVTGVLAARGLNVLWARIFTRSDGAALEVFRVRGTHGPVPQERWESIRADIASALAGRLDVGAALRSKAGDAGRPRRTVEVPVRVVVDNAASDFYTVVEVHAADRLGLLHTITRALADAGCDLHLAKIATYGLEVVDTFYVRDLDGQRIEDEGALRTLSDAVRAALG